MIKIVLDQPIKIGEEEVKELTLDFESLTGNAILAAETEARAMGDKTPQLLFSMKFQAAIASKASKVPIKIIIDLPAGKFQEIMMEVNHFLFSQGLASE